MDIQEKKVFDAYFKEKYPELYKDVFDEDGDDRAIIGYSFAWSAWRAAKVQAVPDGYCVVPREPTPKMSIAYQKNAIAPVSSLSISGYKAMIEAQEQKG